MADQGPVTIGGFLKIGEAYRMLTSGSESCIQTDQQPICAPENKVKIHNRLLAEDAADNEAGEIDAHLANYANNPDKVITIEDINFEIESRPAISEPTPPPPLYTNVPFIVGGVLVIGGIGLITGSVFKQFEATAKEREALALGEDKNNLALDLIFQSEADESLSQMLLIFGAIAAISGSGLAAYGYGKHRIELRHFEQFKITPQFTPKFQGLSLEVQF
ncbi:hypothetical protein ACFL5U_02675 [Candidatus Margulisiibacteriota bacterium]